MSDGESRRTDQGKGFAGIHSATDTFYGWPEYGALVGAYFDGHPWHQPVTLLRCFGA